MPINICDIRHDLLPVRALDGDHLNEVKGGRYTHALSRLESNGKVSLLLHLLEGGVRDLVGDVGVQHCAECHPVVPAATEVRYVDLYVA